MRLRPVSGLELEQEHPHQDLEEAGQDPHTDLHHREAMVYHHPRDLQ